MYFSKLKIKVITIILLTTFIFPFPFRIKKAQAILPVFDEQVALILSGFLPDKDSNPISISNMMKTGLKLILRSLTQSIVTWIDSGFEGNPAFITNTGQFLRDTADITIGDFLMNDPALSFLCDPFKLQVKLALGLQYRPFQEQIQCSFTSALGNVNDAMNNFMNGDFIGGGGWDSWLQLTTVPQNNQMGAMILAQAELDARIEGSKQAVLKEADWGGGFMSWKDCPDFQTETNDTMAARGRYAEVTGQERGDDGCVIKTPGGVIANKINWADTSTLRELEIANDFNAIINALANQLIIMGMSSLSDSGLLGSGKKTQDNTYNEYMSYLNNLDIQSSGSSGSAGSDSGAGNYNSNGTVNFNQPFADNASALQAIDTQKTIEDQYDDAQDNIYRLLDTTQNIFATSNCSPAIKTETINQITGDYTGAKDLNWNKKDVIAELNITSTNISTLDAIGDSVSSSGNSSIAQSLASVTTLHPAIEVINYSAGGSDYEDIRTWIISKINNNMACVGDISALGTWGIE